MTAESEAIRVQYPWLARLAVVGIGIMAVGCLVAPDRLWPNLLLGAYYVLTLALGGAVFVALTDVSGAGWHVAFRRVPEALARLLPLASLLLAIVLLLGMGRYGWPHDGDHVPGTFRFKELWWTVGYLVFWMWLARSITARSAAQDQPGSTAETAANVRLSALFLAIYAVTFSLASIDWIMALEPLWFSTMWGVYHFAGMFQSTLAVVILLALAWRQDHGPLAGIFRDDHLHDLGRLLLGFSCFWMYIWFCQYMLIWYSNLPEETSYFITRTHGPWGPVVIASVVLNWLLPFFLLLPKPAKRSAGAMARIAVLVLIGRWVDLYVMIFPATLTATDAQGVVHALPPTFGIWEAATLLGLATATAFCLSRTFLARPPVPRSDPFLREPSLAPCNSGSLP